MSSPSTRPPARGPICWASSNTPWARVEAEQGPGAVAGQATTLAGNLHGFEFLTGPYAVSELRVSRALVDRGASLPADGAHIYLTDTLENPDADPPQPPLFLQPIAEQRARGAASEERGSGPGLSR